MALVHALHAVNHGRRALIDGNIPRAQLSLGLAIVRMDEATKHPEARATLHNWRRFLLVKRLAVEYGEALARVQRMAQMNTAARAATGGDT